MIVRPNDTVILALDFDPKRGYTREDLQAIQADLETLVGNDIRVIPLVGLKESFIVRSDET
jgi:hypothetical protein